MMGDLKSYTIKEIEFLIDIIKNEIQKINNYAGHTNEYRFGKMEAYKKSMSLIKELKKDIEKYGFEEDPEEDTPIYNDTNELIKDDIQIV